MGTASMDKIRSPDSPHSPVQKGESGEEKAENLAPTQTQNMRKEDSGSSLAEWNKAEGLLSSPNSSGASSDNECSEEGSEGLRQRKNANGNTDNYTPTLLDDEDAEDNHDDNHDMCSTPPKTKKALSRTNSRSPQKKDEDHRKKILSLFGIDESKYDADLNRIPGAGGPGAVVDNAEKDANLKDKIKHHFETM
jgi:hypothetical protein